MKKYLLCFIVGLTLFLNLNEVKAQNFYEKYIPTSLDSLLVANVDTVFVIGLHNNLLLNNAPILYLTKKGDTINLFKYDLPYEFRTRMPSAISRKVALTHSIRDFFIKNVFLNKLFVPVRISNEEVYKLWQTFMSYKPLEMKDDIRIGLNCPDDYVTQLLMYPSGIRLTFLTKEEIKHFFFYQPELVDKACPGNPSRKTIIEIKKLLSAYGEFRAYI